MVHKTTTTLRMDIKLNKITFGYLFFVLWTTTTTMGAAAFGGSGSSRAPHHHNPRALIASATFVDWEVRPGGVVAVTLETVERLQQLGIAVAKMVTNTPRIQLPLKAPTSYKNALFFKGGQLQVDLNAVLGQAVREYVEAWDMPERWAAPYPTLPGEAPENLRCELLMKLEQLGVQLRTRCHGVLYGPGVLHPLYSNFGYDVLMMVLDFNRLAEPLINNIIELRSHTSNVGAAASRGNSDASCFTTPMTSAAASVGSGDASCVTAAMMKTAASVGSNDANCFTVPMTTAAASVGSSSTSGFTAPHHHSPRAVVEKVGAVEWAVLPCGHMTVTRATFLRLTALGEAVVDRIRRTPSPPHELSRQPKNTLVAIFYQNAIFKKDVQLEADAKLAAAVRGHVEAWDKPEGWAAPYPTQTADASQKSDFNG